MIWVFLEVLYAEETRGLIARYAIRHSPDVIMDDVIVCRGQPGEGELKALLNLT